MTKNTICDHESLELLLSDKLTEEKREAMESHLDECTLCRERLEKLAAEPALWTEAHEALSSADNLPEYDRWTAAENSSILSRADADVARAEHIVGFLAPTDDPRMLGRFGGYEIAGVIGCGGMGIVMKGLDVALNRYVAIKVLAPHLATSAAARMRFAREARAAAAVVHENVVAIHAVSEAGGLPYLVMPYVRGMSLQKRLDAQGPLAAAEILRIGRQVAAGMAAAHAQGLVHRDIKPANILLEDGVERLTITDFGLARAADDASLTRSGIIAGTPQFMSPEQARGDSIDARSDLFSLGSVLYTLCTGHAPFRAETPYGVLRRISDDTPRPIRDFNPEIPAWLSAIVEKLHAKSPVDRFQSAGEVAQLFEQCLAHQQQPATVPLPDSLRRRPVSPAADPRRERRWLAALATAVVLIGVGVWAFRERPKTDTSGGERRADVSLPGNDLEKPIAESRSALARWDDGVGEQISELEADIEEFEVEVK
jgi:serine/threonine-protein kinase